MIEELDRLVDEIGARHSKLVLIVGTTPKEKTALINALAKRREITPLNLSAKLAG